MSIIQPSSLSATSTSDASLDTVDNETGGIADNISGMGQYFADLLGSFQLSDSDSSQQAVEQQTTQTDTSAEILSGSEDAMEELQQGLMASLGAGLFGGLTGSGDLDELTSTTSLASMQSNLLASLQSSLFSSLSANTDDLASEVVPKTAVDEKGASLMEMVNEFSFGEDGLELDDVFDTLNVLQHVPIVSNFYEDFTGQSGDAVASLAGGFLYGGPTGLAVSAVDLLVEGFTGKSVTDTLVDFDYSGYFFGEDSVLDDSKEIVKQTEDIITGADNIYEFATRTF